MRGRAAIILCLLIGLPLALRVGAAGQAPKAGVYREVAVLRPSPINWTAVPNMSEQRLLTTFGEQIWVVDTAQATLNVYELRNPAKIESGRTRGANSTQTVEVTKSGRLVPIRMWPLPAPLAAASPRVLKCLVFGSDRAWLLDQSSQQAWALAGDAWRGPWAVGEPFAGAAVLIDGTLVLNTPKQPAFLLMAMNTLGQPTRRFGARSAPNSPEPEELLNAWSLAALSEGGFVAVNQTSGLLRRYTQAGELVWEHPPLRTQPASGPFSVVVGPEDRLFVRNGTTPMLEQYDRGGVWMRSITLDLDMSRFASGFRTLGLGFLGTQLVCAGPTAIVLAVSESSSENLSGTVLDTTGAPLKAASVSLRTEAGLAKLEKTGDDGTFTITELPGGTPVQVDVQADGFVTRQLSGTIYQITQVPIVLDRGPAQCVQVTGKDTKRPLVRFSLAIIQNLQGSDSVTRRAGPKREFSSPNGEGCLVAPWPAPWIARIEADGYATFEAHHATEDNAPSLAVELEREARLEMRVHDSDGKPVSGARVTVQDAERARGAAFAVSNDRLASTDEEGAATIHKLAAAEYRIRVQHPDFLISEQVAAVKADRSPLEVSLSKGASVLVHVVSESHQPIAPALVRIDPLGGQPLTKTLACEADSDGTCTITAIPAGNFEATATSRDRARARQRFGITAGQTSATVSIVLRRGVRLTGIVRGMDRYPGKSLDVAVSVPGAPLLSTPVLDNGQFAVNDVTAGSASVWVRDRKSAAALTFDRIDIPSDPGPSYDIVVELPSPKHVSGLVTVAGVACASCPIVFVLDGAAMGRPTVTTTTAFDGSYTADLPVAGLYTVAIRHQRTGQTLQETLQLDGDARADFELNGLEALGQVYREDDHRPVRQAIVSCVRIADGVTTGDTMSDDVGRFKFSGLQPGSYKLTATDSQSVGSIDVQVDDGSPVRADIALKHGSTVKLRLIDAESGLPIWSVSTRVGLGPAQGITTPSLYADDRGVITIPVGAPTIPTLVLKAQGYAFRVLRNLSATDEPILVRLSPGGRSFWVDVSSRRSACRFELNTVDGLPMPLTLARDPGPVPFQTSKAFFTEVEPGDYRAVVHYCNGGSDIVPMRLVSGNVPIAHFGGQ